MTTRSAQLDATATHRALPPELIDHVIESVLPSNSHALLPASHASTRTLLALAQVCRDTYGLATKLLRQRCVYIDTRLRLGELLRCVPRFVPSLPPAFSLRNLTSLYLQPFGEDFCDKSTAIWVRELLCEVSETLRRLVVLMPFRSIDLMDNLFDVRRTLREGFERLHKLEEFVAIGDYPDLSVSDGHTDVWRLWPDLKRLTLFEAPLDSHWLWWDIATLPKLQHVVLAQSRNLWRANIKDEYFHKLPQDDARLDRDIRIVLMEAWRSRQIVTTTRWKEIDPKGRMTVELCQVSDKDKTKYARDVVAAHVKDRTFNGRLWDERNKVVEESENEA